MSSVANLIQTAIGDGARTTKYDVAFQFTNPSMFPSAQNVAVMVKTTAFPGKLHQTIDFKYAGRSIPIRGQIKYTNTWECTFYLPQDHSIKKAFESWIDALDETVYFENTPSTNVSRTRSLHNRRGYTTDIAIYQLDFTGQNQVARYILHNVFPIEVQPVTVNSDGPGDIEELSVTFSFSHYELETLKSSSGAFVDNLVNKISSELADVGSNLLNKLGSEIASFLPGSLGDGAILDDIANLPQKIIDSVNLSKMSDEVCSLFDGLNPGYKIPDFISPGIKYAKESFDNLVEAGSNLFANIKNAFSNTGSGAAQTANKTPSNGGSNTV